MPFIFQNKGKIFSGEELAPDSNALVALRFLRKLKLKGFCPPYNPSESFPVRKLFSAGHASMLIGNFKDYLAIKEESCFDIGITQLPGSKQNATSLSVQGWGISQASFATPSTIEHFYQKALAFEMLESCKRIPAFQNEHFNIPKEFMDALELAKRSWDSPARFLLPELNEKMLFFWLGVSPENKTKGVEIF
jgi:hypothetical protein